MSQQIDLSTPALERLLPLVRQTMEQVAIVKDRPSYVEYTEALIVEVLRLRALPPGLTSSPAVAIREELDRVGHEVRTGRMRTR